MLALIRSYLRSTAFLGRGGIFILLTPLKPRSVEIRGVTDDFKKHYLHILSVSSKLFINIISIFSFLFVKRCEISSDKDKSTALLFELPVSKK